MVFIALLALTGWGTWLFARRLILLPRVKPEPISREQRIAELRQQHRHALHIGDIATADQIEAHLRDLTHSATEG